MTNNTNYWICTVHQNDEQQLAIYQSVHVSFLMDEVEILRIALPIKRNNMYIKNKQYLALKTTTGGNFKGENTFFNSIY